MLHFLCFAPGSQIITSQWRHQYQYYRSEILLAGAILDLAETSFSWNFISFAKAKPKQIKNCEIYSCSDLNAKLNSALKFTKAVQNDDQTYLYYWLKLLVLSVTHKDSILNCNPKIVLF